MESRSGWLKRNRKINWKTSHRTVDNFLVGGWMGVGKEWGHPSKPGFTVWQKPQHCAKEMDPSTLCGELPHLVRVSEFQNKASLFWHMRSPTAIQKHIHIVKSVSWNPYLLIQGGSLMRRNSYPQNGKGNPPYLLQLTSHCSSDISSWNGNNLGRRRALETNKKLPKGFWENLTP